tara:strand:- start:180 stop:428 length:249 start_codon:yes stop_codon:yes gene_type:complete
MGRRKPYAFGTQNVTDFQDNVKKNNNGKNGNGTGNKTTDTSNIMIESKESLLNPGPSTNKNDKTVQKLEKQVLDFAKENRPK